MDKALRIFEPLCLLLAPLFLLCCALFSVESSVLLSMFSVLLSILPSFLRFERQKPRPRDLMPIVVFSALCVAGRLLFQPFPSFKPVSAIVIVCGICFGKQSGFLTGALSALVSNMFLGQGPWTPWQMYAWGVIGYLAGSFAQSGLFAQSWRVYLYGFFSALLYGAVLDSYYIVGFIHPLTLSNALLAYGTGLPLNLTHGVATVVFLLPIYRPWTRKLERIKQKFGLLDASHPR